MSREEMLDYVKQLDRKHFNTEGEAKDKVNKVEALLKKFAFDYYKSFSHYCNDFSNKKPDTSWFYRFKTGEYDYIEVQVGYIIKQSKSYGRNKKRYPQGFEGLLRVHNHIASINPDTGKPWAIGDTKTHESGCYSVTLTKRGWYSGD
jgi:hypothetical protein